MNKQELINSLGTIAKSGTEEFIKKLETKKNSNIEQIGKFGVGFYSGFMVAKKIEVITKNSLSKESWKWISDGKGKFEIEPAKRENRGTTVILYLKQTEKDFSERIRIENIIRKWT